MTPEVQGHILDSKVFMFRVNPKVEAFPEIRGLGERGSNGVQHQHTGNICHSWVLLTLKHMLNFICKVKS